MWFPGEPSPAFLPDALCIDIKDIPVDGFEKLQPCGRGEKQGTDKKNSVDGSAVIERGENML